jgi:flagellar assembly protein FliH
MSDMPTVKLPRSIGTINLVENPSAAFESSATSVLEEENEASLAVNLEKQKQQYDLAIQSLESAAEKMHAVYEKMIVEHRQAIAKLAVEIARKILAQKAKDGDYQIETIIQEALNNAPSHQDVVVRLNPADHARCQQMPKTEGMPASVKLIADPKIGPAECIIETPRGKVESLIDDHLEHVARALSKAV